MDIIPVNKVIKEFKSSGNLTDQIPSGSIFLESGLLSGSDCKMSRREVNVEISPQKGGHYIDNIPICDSEDAAYFSAIAQKFPYTAIGCISVAVKGLFRKNTGVKGRILIIDDMWDNLEQAALKCFEFDLNEGYAAFCVYPSYSMTSKDMGKFRLRALVEFTELNVRSGGYQPIALSFGLICRSGTTAFPPKKGILSDADTVHQELANTKAIDFFTHEECRRSFDDLFDNTERKIFLDAGKTVRRERKRGLLKKNEPVKVLNFKAIQPAISLAKPDVGTPREGQEIMCESSGCKSNQGEPYEDAEENEQIVPRRSVSFRAIKMRSVLKDAREAIRGTVGDAVTQSVYESSDLVPDELFVAEPNRPRKREQALTLLKLRAYGEVFGNIALLGASEETTFPADLYETEKFKLPEYSNELTLKFKLSDVVKVIKTMADVPGPCFNKTFRQLCEPFAEDAKSFLHGLYQDCGETTLLASKMAKLSSAAPWVAFDFNGGLIFKRLKEKEKSVIQNMNRRLFNTSAKKEITEASVEGASQDATV